MISNFGRLKSLPRNGTIKEERIIVPDIRNRDGRCQVLLHKKGKLIKKYIHQLVGIAFIPNPDNKPQINHIDGNPTNNMVSNLEWNSAKENNDHALKTGLKAVDGENNNNSKLKAVDVWLIRKLMFSISDGRNIFDISKTTIQSIKNNKSCKLLIYNQL